MVAGGEQHVGRLDVAVDEPALVRDVQRRADLRDHVRDAIGGQGARRPHERPQVLPVDVAHRDVQLVAVLARVVDGEHVRVLDRRRRPRLAQEPRAEVGIAGQGGRDELQRDDAVERQLRRPVHHAHAATAGESLDAVTGEHVTGMQVGHPTPF